ncbi:MAG: hypothetical protein QME76_08685 [Bacillota bacterium]|nr:hypothetical protein [Bacillota bacterium]
MNGEVVLTVINEVPVIGTRYLQKEQALEEVKKLVARVSEYAEDGQARVRVNFQRQGDGRYTLQVFNGQELMAEMPNLDELLLHRFRKAYYAKKMFILTCFVDGRGPEPHSLVITDGLGVVIYKPGDLALP